MKACPACGSPVPIRWRNDGPAVATVHVAGPVIDVVEPRRSCPGYIADRYQECERCGDELVHGRWAAFFFEGEQVAQIGERAPIFGPAGRWADIAPHCLPQQRTPRARLRQSGLTT